jgi:hypothetical protein
MKKQQSPQRPVASRTGELAKAIAAIPAPAEGTPERFEHWMRSMPKPVHFPVAFTARIQIEDDMAWAQLLAIMAHQSWTLDRAINEMLTGQVICDFWNALPTPEEIEAMDAEKGGAK